MSSQKRLPKRERARHWNSRPPLVFYSPCLQFFFLPFFKHSFVLGRGILLTRFFLRCLLANSRPSPLFLFCIKKGRFLQVQRNASFKGRPLRHASPCRVGVCVPAETVYVTYGWDSTNAATAICRETTDLLRTTWRCLSPCTAVR